MARQKQIDALSIIKTPPATTPEARNLELTAKAYDLVEKRINEGTASAQETMHFLKLGTERERLEQLKLAGEIELQKARIDQIASQANMEQMFSKAIDAMITYQGGDPSELREIEAAPEEGEFVDED